MNDKECDCEWYQCCDKCMDKFDFQGKNILEPIYDGLILMFNITKAMKKAAKKWGDMR